MTDVRARNKVSFTGRADGPVVMLAHGFGCDQNMWRQVTPRRGGARIGSCSSTMSAPETRIRPRGSAERYADLEAYADDVLEICHDLDLHDVVFVGHSVSAMIGVLAANRSRPGSRRSCLLTPSPCYIDDAGYRGGFTPPTSPNCWSPSTATISAGPRRWHRSSWAIPTGPNSAPS